MGACSDSCHPASPRPTVPPGFQPLAEGDKEVLISLPATLAEYLTSSPFKVTLCGLGQVAASLWAAFSSFLGTLCRRSEPCGLTWPEPQNHPERLVNDPPIFQMQKRRLRKREAARQGQEVHSGHHRGCGCPRGIGASCPELRPGPARGKGW